MRFRQKVNSQLTNLLDSYKNKQGGLTKVSLRQYALATTILFIALACFVATGSSLQTSRSSAQFSKQPQVLATQQVLPKKPRPPQDLTAKAYILYDEHNNKLITGYNIAEELPIASLTKLVTAAAVARNLKPSAVVTVAPEALLNLPKPLLGLFPGEKISVSALTQGMLVASHNDAAQVIAYALGQGNYAEGLKVLNNTAADLGMAKTKLNNPTGLDEGDARSTASDLLLAVQEVRRSPWLMSILAKRGGVVYSTDGKTSHAFTTTDRLLTQRADLVLGGKTGYTSEARGNLMILARTPSGLEVTAIILGSEDREGEMNKILDWLIANYH